MRGDGARQLAYLESLDPVRSSSPEQASTTRLQVQMELLAALALGRDVVVPQSFAFDSGAFHQVASQIWALCDQIDGAISPFRLHLFNAQTFQDAVGAMLQRTRAEPHSRFVSSLFPELADEWDVSADPTIDNLLRHLGDSDPRYRTMRRIDERFRHARPAPAGTAANGTTLPQMIVDLHTRDAPAEWGRVHRRIRRSMDALEIRQGVPNRSLLRSGDHWPTAPGAQSARDLIGEEDLALLVEAVDTLYNRVVAQSTGSSVQVFTTAFTQDTEHRAAQGLAQRIALVSAAGVARDDGAPQAGTGFEVVVESPGAGGPLAPELVEHLSAQDMMRSGYEALLRAQAEPGGPFTRSLAKLATAARADQDKALEEHAHLVGEMLGEAYRVKASAKGELALSCSLAIGGASVGQAQQAVLAGGAIGTGVTVALAAVGPLVSHSISRARSAGQARRTRRLFAGAITDIVRNGRLL